MLRNSEKESVYNPPRFAKHWLVKVLYQRLLVIILILIQFYVFVHLAVWVSEISTLFNWLMRLFAWLAVLGILASQRLVIYKLSWIILVLAFPIVGAPLYAVLSTNAFSRKLIRRLSDSLRIIAPLRRKRPALHDALKTVSPNQNKLANYISDTVGYPLYPGGRAEYLAQGEQMYEHMMRSIRRAKKYVFLEFFIVENGYMLEEMIELLEKKAAEGVEVKFLYDDMGSIFRVPREYPAMLGRKGIDCRRFNHLIPVLSTQFNNRDHRKMVVIDGEVAYTGGINIADEYINVKERFGHWKDGGVVFYGEAAWAMSLMFFELWTAAGEGWPLSESDILSYCPKPDYLEMEQPLSPEEKAMTGFIQPYGDTPFDQVYAGRNAYKQLSYSAAKYIYITTPYLVLDHDMVDSLALAARSGVDVRIIVPHIWDKFYVRIVSQSYYKEFIKAGVKIYEYTPGFIHAKTLVTDDQTAVVGTINFDYRSLYLHFEDAVAIYNQPCVQEVYEDFLATQALSQEIRLENFKQNIWARAFASLLRLFAPLM